MKNDLLLLELEDLGPVVYGTSHGEALSWSMGAHRAVFDLAPHMLAANRNEFQHPSRYAVEHDACRDPRYVGDPDYASGCTSQRDAAQSDLKGDYDSSAWYHLQVLLHAGARSQPEFVPWDASVEPVDWPYSMMHVDDVDRCASGLDPDGQSRCAGVYPIAGAAGRAWEPVRYLATLMKVYQMRDNNQGPVLTGWALRDVGPRLLVSNYRGYSERTELLTELDGLTPGTRAAVTNAFLRAFHLVTQGPHAVEAVHSFDPWRRFSAGCDDYEDDTPCIDRDTWFMIDPETQVTGPKMNDTGAGFAVSEREFGSGGHFSQADDIWNALPLLRGVPGVRTMQVNNLRDWAQRLWPGPSGAPNSWSAR